MVIKDFTAIPTALVYVGLSRLCNHRKARLRNRQPGHMSVGKDALQASLSDRTAVRHVGFPPVFRPTGSVRVCASVWSLFRRASRGFDHASMQHAHDQSLKSLLPVRRFGFGSGSVHYFESSTEWMHIKLHMGHIQVTSREPILSSPGLEIEIVDGDGTVRVEEGTDRIILARMGKFDNNKIMLRKVEARSHYEHDSSA